MRKANLNPRKESWTSDQLISLEQAIYAFTLGAAKGSQNQSMLGSFSPGKLADMIIINDYRQEPPNSG